MLRKSKPLLTRAVLIPGQSAKSLIIQAVEGAGELKMLPGNKLPLEAIAALRQWIDTGAPWQQQEAKGETTLDDFWAFQPLRKPAGSASVEAFILQRLREAGLSSAPHADKAMLIRRATFDLVGLPPLRMKSMLS